MMRSIDRLLSSKSFLRIISLLVATLVWYYITADRGIEIVRTVTVPVEYLNLPSDMSVSSRVREVDVQVSGTREFAFSLGGAVASQIDLNGLEPGLHRRSVQVLLPSGVKLVEVSPPNIEVELTRIRSRLLPVRFEPPEDLPPGYRIEEVKIIPEEVMVKGPEEDISDLEYLWVFPKLDQILGEKEVLLPVESSIKISETKEPLLTEPSQAAFSFSLVKGFPRKVVPVRVEIKGSPNRDFQIEAVAVDPPEVTIQGPLESIERIDQLFLPPMDVTGLSRDLTTVVPTGAPAEEVEVVGNTSVRVRILLSKRIENRLYVKIPVRIVGKSIYPGWRVEPEEVSIVLEGSPSDLDAAESRGAPVEAFVEVTNLVSTKLRVPVQTSIKIKGLKVSGIDPANVTVYALTE